MLRKKERLRFENIADRVSRFFFRQSSFLSLHVAQPSKLLNTVHIWCTTLIYLVSWSPTPWFRTFISVSTGAFTSQIRFIASATDLIVARIIRAIYRRVWVRSSFIPLAPTSSSVIALACSIYSSYQSRSRISNETGGPSARSPKDMRSAPVFSARDR